MALALGRKIDESFVFAADLAEEDLEQDELFFAVRFHLEKVASVHVHTRDTLSVLGATGARQIGPVLARRAQIDLVHGVGEGNILEQHLDFVEKRRVAATNG